MENKYVLAMYDVRAKQNYIYRSKKLKEIQGASAIIRDVFDDYLFWAAKVVKDKKYIEPPYSFSKGDVNIEDEAIYTYKRKEKEKEEEEKKKQNNISIDGEKFDYDNLFMKRTYDNNNCKREVDKNSKGHYLGEVIYDGGGNFLVMYQNEDICKKVTYVFTRQLLNDRPGLNVLCTYVEANENYKKDSDNLYKKHWIHENQESMIPPYGTLPIVQADYISSMPLTKKVRRVQKERPDKVTAESFAKYNKFYDEDGDKKVDAEGSLQIDEKILDNLVTEKGKESLLAIIYIDGNSMGAKVQNLLTGVTSYDDCVNKLREFSEYIQTNCVDERKGEIDDILCEKLSKKEGRELHKEEMKNRRLVVAAGDEITVICNARYAYDIAKEYLENIYEKTKEGKYDPITSCAGIAIFHSHTPFTDAYRIAEECCESGKKKMKELKLGEAGFLDFHYCQGAIGISLEEIREKDETEDFSLPWLIKDVTKHSEGQYSNHSEERTAGHSEERSDEESHKKLIRIKEIEDLKDDLNEIGRSNVKGLAEKAKEGLSALETEIKRICAHRKEGKEGLNILKVLADPNEDADKKEKYRKLIYDMVIVYDLWFAEK